MWTAPIERQARRRGLDGQEVVDVLDRDQTALAHAQCGGQILRERVRAHVRRLDETLCAVKKTCDRDSGAAAAPRCVHRLQDSQSHQFSFST